MPTRSLAALPPDLITWAQAADVVALSPHPMSERNLRRLYTATERRTWNIPGVRAELVSRSDVLEWHRDHHQAR